MLDDTSVQPDSPSRTRVIASLSIAGILALAALVLVEDPLRARTLVIAVVYLTFALSEVVAPFVPTLFLLVATPLLLGAWSERYQLSAVLGWTADPVLALFAGGLALGLAAQRHGIDRAFAALLVRAAGSSRRSLVAVVLLAAAGTSMWLSNVAAAALLLVALQPLLASTLEPAFRRALLLALAIGANLGGIATPIGSGPNAIAIAATRDTHPITFIRWMSFGVPIVLGMLVVGFVMLVLRYRVRGRFDLKIDAPARPTRKALLLIGVFGATVLAWLSEPLHSVSAPLVALTLMLTLFATGLLRKADLGSLDWSTLGLIAGGLGLGRLLESTQVLTDLAGALALADYPRWLWLGGLVFMSAFLAAIMSNTATAALLIPLGLLLDASPSTAIIVAVATSFGMPLPISTPPNAMVYGVGGIRVTDLLQIGLPLMILGCLLVTLTGTWFLALLGLG